VTIAKATFDGKMVVTDPKALKSAMTMGIGPGKAYGCGLLTLAALS
jgi:CRISPR system Cascade subunit CasE